MEKNSAPLPSDVIPLNTKTPMKGSDLNFNLINMNNNQENSDSEDSGDFTPNNPNKPPKPKKEGKIKILGKNIVPDLKFKVIVLGNMNVGKSCLALRATEGLFKENLGTTVPLSICSFNVKIDETKISLQIWDTCGQEKYRALIKGYYTNSSLAIIVYSVTDKDSFEDVNVWYKLVKENLSDCKIFLIANKVDSPERVITTEQGNKCRNDFNFDLFMETSAKTGFNTQELFAEAGKLLYKEYSKFKKKEKLGGEKLKKEGVKKTPENKKKCC